MDKQQIKICTGKCGLEKLLNAFNKNIHSKDGYFRECRECVNIRRKSPQNKETSRIYAEKWRKQNPDKIKEMYIKNADKNIKYAMNWNKNHPDAVKAANKLYYTNNKSEIITNQIARSKERMKTDQNFLLSVRLRDRMKKAVKNGYRSGSAVRDLGCSIDFFRLYIQDKFQPDMLWDNYGEWHLDHIIPLSFFDLTDREQFLRAAHYSNYQPLWSWQNLEKSDKLDWEIR